MKESKYLCVCLWVGLCVFERERERERERDSERVGVKSVVGGFSKQDK